MIQGKELENWQNLVMALEEFCLKLAYIASAHISLAKVGHMAKPDISGMGSIRFPVGGELQVP